METIRFYFYTVQIQALLRLRHLVPHGACMLVWTNRLPAKNEVRLRSLEKDELRG